MKLLIAFISGWVGKTIYDHIHYNYVDDETENST